MLTIAPRLFLATTMAGRQLGFSPPIAHHAITSHLIAYHPVARAAAAASLPHGTALGAVVFLVLAVVLVGALSSAARGLAEVMSELLRAATAVTSIFFTILIAAFFAIVILVHH